MPSHLTNLCIHIKERLPILRQGPINWSVEGIFCIAWPYHLSQIALIVGWMGEKPNIDLCQCYLCGSFAWYSRTAPSSPRHLLLVDALFLYRRPAPLRRIFSDNEVEWTASMVRQLTTNPHWFLHTHPDDVSNSLLQKVVRDLHCLTQQTNLSIVRAFSRASVLLENWCRHTVCDL